MMIMGYTWLYHTPPYKILSPKKGGSYFLISPHGWFHSSLFFRCPFLHERPRGGRRPVLRALDAGRLRAAFRAGRLAWNLHGLGAAACTARASAIHRGFRGSELVGTNPLGRGYLGNLGDGDGMSHPQWILVFLLLFWFSKHIHTFEHILGSYECNGI